MLTHLMPKEKAVRLFPTRTSAPGGKVTCAAVGNKAFSVLSSWPV